MVTVRIGLFTVLAGLASFALAQRLPTPDEIANKLEKAAGSATYVAVRKVTMRGAEGKPRVFDERVIRSRGRLYLSYFPDSPYADLKIWEMKGKRYTYSISTNELRMVDALGLEESMRFLRSKPTVANGEQVAGRTTYRVSGPFDGGRVTQTLWVDSQQWVLLKRQIEDGRGDVIGGFEVSEITFNVRIPESKFALPKDAKIISLFDDLKRLAKEVGVDDFRLAAPGYRLQNVGKFSFQDTPILRSFYINGETRVSLFVFKGNGDHFKRAGQLKMYRWQVNGQTLVLVGDLDEKQLEKLAKSVKS